MTKQEQAKPGEFLKDLGLIVVAIGALAVGAELLGV
jgi:hypothetical protein